MTKNEERPSTKRVRSRYRIRKGKRKGKPSEIEPAWV
eukprot:CAMPEP_0185357320 /NCGR_PEP_ID=MMETSP1364-20130426/7388_1 /TAXON_ID=38817 /ORGANISM="Gephyrocapsa oceanica, Strain RCC1303" /LENGTH=36 /DNA_ID= /DNA_START= /DNA_END= /DNA_ORIENTATION=